MTHEHSQLLTLCHKIVGLSMPSPSSASHCMMTVSPALRMYSACGIKVNTGAFCTITCILDDGPFVPKLL